MSRRTPESLVLRSAADRIHNENPLFVQLGHLMSDPENRLFLREQFSSWSDVKVLVMYIKSYQSLMDEYEEQLGVEPSAAQISAMLKHIMEDNLSRRHLVQRMQLFFENDNLCQPVHLFDFRRLSPYLLTER
jgi:hypothetical protein